MYMCSIIYYGSINKDTYIYPYIDIWRNTALSINRIGKGLVAQCRGKYMTEWDIGSWCWQPDFQVRPYEVTISVHCHKSIFILI